MKLNGKLNKTMEDATDYINLKKQTTDFHVPLIFVFVGKAQCLKG